MLAVAVVWLTATAGVFQEGRTMTLGELLTSGYERVYDEIREGDMIRTLVGISEANDKWIGATLEDMGSAARGVEIWRKGDSK